MEMIFKHATEILDDWQINRGTNETELLASPPLRSIVQFNWKHSANNENGLWCLYEELVWVD